MLDFQSFRYRKYCKSYQKYQHRHSAYQTTSDLTPFMHAMIIQIVWFFRKIQFFWHEFNLQTNFYLQFTLLPWMTYSTLKINIHISNHFELLYTSKCQMYHTVYCYKYTSMLSSYTCILVILIIKQLWHTICPYYIAIDTYDIIFLYAMILIKHVWKVLIGSFL